MTPRIDPKTRYWMEALEIAFTDCDAKALHDQLNDDQKKQIAWSLETSDDNESLAFGRPEQSHDCDSDKIRSLKAIIADLEQQISCYQKSVMHRRNADHVWIDSGGSVCYE